MTEKHRQAIADRDTLLKVIETELRDLLKKRQAQLTQANSEVFQAGAEGNTQSQIFQLLQDRLQETAFPGCQVHRH